MLLHFITCQAPCLSTILATNHCLLLHLSLGVLQVVISSQGQLDSCWLYAPRSAAAGALLVKPSSSRSSRARQQQAGASSSSSSSVQAAVQPEDQQAGAAAVQAESAATAAAAAAATTASPGKPCRVPGTGLQAAGCSSCGWVFDQQDMFDQKLLLQLLQLLQPHVMRLKGVFRVAQKQWVMPQFMVAPLQQQQRRQQHGNKSPGQTEQQQQQQQTASCADSTAGQKEGLQLQPVCYRGPSMVEVIVSAAPFSAANAKRDAAAAVASPVSRVVADFLQQQKERCGAAVGSSNSSSTADDAAVAQAGVGRLTLNGAGTKLPDSTWQVIEEALLACLQQTK
jgi:hypothetical protein